jgi:hypothetical protein
MMSLVHIPAHWVSDITGHFPAPIQPGLYATICLLILWLLIRRRRPIWNTLIRWASVTADLTVGLILLPEYMWTRARRAHGQMPALLAVTGSPIAERALDRAAGAYERHGRIKVTGRPPLVSAGLLCLASLALHWLMLRPGAQGPPEFAAKIWSYWASFSHWTQHG